ncbi:hypothetical protein KA405_01670 [Patescibacteria group bacterium]|nr:hypothetical protein [Patescibacteria group bacterium]
MVQKNKSIGATIQELVDQIKERVYITPLIAGLIFLFLFWQIISAIGFFLIAWSKNEPKNFNTTPESFNTQSVVLLVVGTALVILGLVL